MNDNENWRCGASRADLLFSLKGWDSSAQGNALGSSAMKRGGFG